MLPCFRRSRLPMIVSGLLVAVAGFTAVGTGRYESAQASTVVKTTKSTCSAMAGLSVPPAAIGLPTRGATVVSATLVPNSDSGNKGGEYCKVLGTIHPVDFLAPEIHVEVDLPTNFNGKSVHFGGGGFDGTIPDLEGQPDDSFTFGLEPAGVATPLRRGFVTFGSDGGHVGNFFDGSFAANDEALANYAGDHVKKTHDFAVFLERARYGSASVHSYFIGASGGGRQALIAAQRFPTDYDGIISTFPASGITGIWLQMGRISKALLAPGGFVNAAKGAAIQAAVMKQCDALDGVADGMISNPSACVFDPKTVRCPGGADTGDTCLSDAQITTMRVAGSPLITNFDLANGIRSFPAYNAFAGTDFWSGDYYPNTALGASARDAMIEPGVVGKTSFYYSFSNDMLRFAIARDPSLSILTFDPQSSGPLTARIQAISALMDGTTTDLTKFAKRGGKLILQHGQSDQYIPAQMTIDYYNRLAERFGHEKLGQFVKFYLVPGAAHGEGGQFKGSYDALTALDNWVTNGKEPKNLTITDFGMSTAGRTRPLCEYPLWPKYVGGDQNLASSFVCSH